MIPGGVNPMLLSVGGSGYQLQRSLRIRGSAGAYITRTFGAATNRGRSTYSVWVKRGDLGRQPILSGYSAPTDRGYIEFDASGRLSYDDFYSGGQSILKTSTAKFRDLTGWYHVVVNTDVTNTTPEDRIVMYVNSVRITSWDTNTIPGTGASPSINGSRVHVIGAIAAGVALGDGYIAHPVFVDGQVLTPSAFGESDASGNWRPKAYTGTYGANGTAPDFSDPASLTTLMLDRSGNGNNWTANGISLTAGVAYDSMLDVPLGGGGNERGNYATLNPLFRHVITCSAINGNLTLQNGAATSQSQNINGSVVANSPVYLELTMWNVGGGINGVGFCGFSKPSVVYPSLAYPGSVADSFGFGVSQSTSWYSRKEGAAATPLSLANATDGDIMQIAYNPTTGNAWVGKNGVWNGSGNPATGANPDLTGMAWGDVVPSLSMWNNGSSSLHWHVNFGQRPFSYTPPTGFKALHTGNLTSDTVTVSGSFTGNAIADGPAIWMNGAPETLTINGNAVTWGTHADKLAGGFKLRTSSASYNSSGTNTWTATVLTPASKSAFRKQLAKTN